jgi:hypothetical protein
MSSIIRTWKSFSTLPIPTCSPTPLQFGYHSLELFRFGDLKRKLKGEEFATTEELQGTVEELLGQRTRETMQRVDDH